MTFIAGSGQMGRGVPPALDPLPPPPPPPTGPIEDCGITDTFTRTVADVPHSTVGAVDGGWGTSDSGRLWQMQIYQSAACSAYVDGSVGVIHTVGNGSWSNGASAGHDMHNVSFPTGDWDLTFDFWWGNLMGTDGRNQGFCYLDLYTSPDCSTGWIGQLNFMNRNSAGLGDSQGTIWFWNYANEYTWDTLWVAQTWYTSKVHYDAASKTLMARVWVRGGTEPSIWHATLVLATPLVVNSVGVGYSNRWGRIGDDQTDFKFDNISLPGVNRCTYVPPFDDFNRTVAAGGWGTSTSGVAWAPYGYSAAALSADGSNGVITFTSGTPAVRAAYIPALAGSWETRVRFMPTTTGSWSVRYRVEKPGGTSITLFTNFDGTLEQGVTSVAASYVAGAWHTLVVSWNRTTGAVGAKVWADGSAEPSGWMITDDYGPGVEAFTDLTIEAWYASGASRTVKFDSIDFV